MAEETQVRNADEDLEFLRLVNHILLARLVGPQEFTIAEMAAIQLHYRGTRTIYNPAEKTFTLSLMPIVRSEGPG